MAQPQNSVERGFELFCPSGHVESEFHVLMLCNRYLDLRSNHFHVAKPLIVNFDNLDVNSKFIAILESQEPSLIQQFSKCIYLIFKMKTETLDTSTCNSNVHDCVNVSLS